MGLYPLKDWTVWAALIILLMVLLTCARNQVWLSPLSMWTDITVKSPRKPRPHLNLGNEYYGRGNIAEAAIYWSRAAQLARSRPRTLDSAYFDYATIAESNIAAVLILQKRFAEAEVILGRLVAERESAETVTNLSLVYVRQGRLDKALDMMNYGVEKYPGYSELLFNRGDFLAALRQCGQANQDYKLAASLNADVPRKTCAQVP